MSNSAVGFFDSGVGGTTIWKEFHKLLPNEDTIYLSDSANSPYGSKSKSQITNLCIKNTEYLLSKNCKLIVVACNTATTNSINTLREEYPIPFIGVQPAVKTAAQTQSKRIGVLATKSTIKSPVFKKSCKDLKECQFIIQEGGDLVKLIETGKRDSSELRDLLTKLCQKLLSANIDSLVLGCSHYPYLTEQIKKILPSHIKIIDSSLPVAKHIKTILEQNKLLNQQSEMGICEFYANNNLTALEKVLDNSQKTKLLYF